LLTFTPIDLGAAQVPAKVQRERDAKTILARRARVRGKPLILGSLIALAAIGPRFFFFLRDRLLRGRSNANGRKSMRFFHSKISATIRRKQFFADGIQDDILTSLADQRFARD